MDEYRDDHLASPGSEDSYPNPIEVSLEDTSFAKEESQEQSDRVGEGATGNVTGGEVPAGGDERVCRQSARRRLAALAICIAQHA